MLKARLSTPDSLLAWFLPAACALVLCAGCGGGPSDADQEPTHVEVDTTAASAQTLVFVDASASASAPKQTAELFKDSLQAAVQARMDEPGDRIRMLPVHGETTSKVGQWKAKNEVQVPEWSAFKQDRKADRIQFYGEVRRFVDSTAVGAAGHLERLREGERFKRWTDLWGTLQVVSEEVDTSGAPARVYYFSDMFESMPAEKRRNFDRRAPASKAEAERWAAEDAGRIPDLIKVRPDVLGHVHVRILPGGLATKKGADAVKYYWERLFREMGAGKVTYN